MLSSTLSVESRSHSLPRSQTGLVNEMTADRLAYRSGDRPDGEEREEGREHVRLSLC